MEFSLLGRQSRSLIFVFTFILYFSSEGALLQPPAYEEFKIALLGDTSAGIDFGNVLKLTAQENSDVIMINGDFGYSSSAETWANRVRTSIDTNKYPVIGALGNHDVLSKTKYMAYFNSFRTTQNNLNQKCTGKPTLKQGEDVTIVDEICTFNNVSIISNGIGQVFTKTYLESRLESKLKEAPIENWKLVGYHYSLASMNPGVKGDENTFKFFDIIRRYGAIGVQAHTHTVMASCPISSSFTKGKSIQCHSDFSDLNDRFILPGVGIYMDSSLGGKEARARERCMVPNSIDCLHLVDLISEEGYTRVDGAKQTSFNRMGALFLVFNTGGDPRKAYAYYKSIDGQTIFSFNITR